MEYEVDVKSELCTVRLTQRQVDALDEVAHGELSRSQLVRMLKGGSSGGADESPSTSYVIRSCSLPERSPLTLGEALLARPIALLPKLVEAAGESRIELQAGDAR